jgi:iron complex outermembrane receptor protein
MKSQKQFVLSTVAAGRPHPDQPGPAAGQAAAPAARWPPPRKSPHEIQQVVVTGTASARGTRKIDTAFSITTANEEQLKPPRQAAPPTS